MTPSSASIPSGIIWTPLALQQRHQNTVVRKINAVCYPAHYVDDPPTKLTNHWNFFFQISGTQSLFVDPKPAVMTNKLQLEITLKDNHMTSHGLLHVTLTPVEGLTIKDVLELITTNRLDRYEFDSDGNGCRYWALQFVAHLNRAEKLENPQEVALLRERLGKTWTMDADERAVEAKPPRGTPPSPGSFLSAS
ncbi:MAG: hypothetical protein M1825_003938 [Sarcosagium campestre]|nr:MAG: hypothetical protein M1825_003938 [Sarcosagium campestre]